MSLTRIAIALTVLSGLTYGLHYYLWARLVRDAALPAPWHGALTAALVLLGASIPLGFFLVRALPRGLATPLAYVTYTWLGAMFFLFVGTVASDALRLAYGFLPPGGADPARRVTLARLLSMTVGAAGLGLTGAALYSASRPVAVKRVRVALSKLGAGLEGYKLVQLTDVHIGPTLGRAFIEQLVARVNALAPDAVVLTGDLVDGSVRELGSFLEPLRELRARDGVFFVTGNHEYYSGADAWIAHLRTLGVRVLRNERVRLERDGAGLDLAGVDDYNAAQFGGDHGMDVAKALAGRDASLPVVLLAHQPRAIEAAARAGVDLQLSGHTHGGQLAPFHLFVKLQQPYNAGLFEHQPGTQLYVSRGTGYWGPPMRLAAPAEITEVVLTRG